MKSLSDNDRLRLKIATSRFIAISCQPLVESIVADILLIWLLTFDTTLKCVLIGSIWAEYFWNWTWEWRSTTDSPDSYPKIFVWEVASESIINILLSCHPTNAPERVGTKKGLLFMVGSIDAHDRVVELVGIFSILAGRHKGRHTVPMGVLCCPIVASWWLEFHKNTQLYLGHFKLC